MTETTGFPIETPTRRGWKRAGQFLSKLLKNVVVAALISSTMAPVIAAVFESPECNFKIDLPTDWRTMENQEKPIALRAHSPDEKGSIIIVAQRRPPEHSSTALKGMLDGFRHGAARNQLKIVGESDTYLGSLRVHELSFEAGDISGVAYFGTTNGISYLLQIASPHGKVSTNQVTQQIIQSFGLRDPSPSHLRSHSTAYALGRRIGHYARYAVVALGVVLIVTIWRTWAPKQKR